MLSQQFASRGLSFFKVNKTVTHVAVARPHFLDLEATPVSDGVKRIVDYINTTPKCTHKRLLQALAPAPAAAPAPPVSPESSPSAEGQASPPAPPVQAEPTPEAAAVMTDLHWLIHQGHVIEFANGVLETAKKPLPKPPKPPKAEPKPAEPSPDPVMAPAAEAGMVTGSDLQTTEAATPSGGDLPATGEVAGEGEGKAEPSSQPASTTETPAGS